jgi:hypothetical protein
MEQWRRVEEARMKRLLLLQSAVALGGCGIWCMHFTGMTAIELRLEDGSTLEIDYELGYTALSLAFPIVGVLIALAIASSDPYFVEMQDERRKEMLVRRLIFLSEAGCSELTLLLNWLNDTMFELSGVQAQDYQDERHRQEERCHSAHQGRIEGVSPTEDQASE